MLLTHDSHLTCLGSLPLEWGPHRAGPEEPPGHLPAHPFHRHPRASLRPWLLLANSNRSGPEPLRCSDVCWAPSGSSGQRCLAFHMGSVCWEWTCHAYPRWQRRAASKGGAELCGPVVRRLSWGREGQHPLLSRSGPQVLPATHSTVRSVVA